MKKNIQKGAAGINNNKIPSHNDPAMYANYTQTNSSLNINNTNMNAFSMAGAFGGQLKHGRDGSGRGLSGRVDGGEKYTFSPHYKENDDTNTNYTQTISLNIQNLSEFNFSMAGACEGQINLGQNESGRGLAGCSNGNSCDIG